MSIKSLALVVVLLVAGVFASVHSYLKVERTPLTQKAGAACECQEAHLAGDVPDAGVVPAGSTAPRDIHRLIRRSSVAMRRGDKLGQIPRDS